MYQREKQGKVSSTDHVDMRINFCAAGFQQRTEMTECLIYTGRIFVCDRLRRPAQGCALFSGVLMKYEYREDITEDHPDRYERNPAEDEHAPSAHGREGRRDLESEMVSVAISSLYLRLRGRATTPVLRYPASLRRPLQVFDGTLG